MRLAHLSLGDFRSYESLELPVSGEHQLFLGPNGAGKTNLLEAIHLLGTGSSPRASRDLHLVRHGAAGFRIGARLEHPGDERPPLRIEVELRERSGKRFTIDKEPARASDLLTAVKVVSFAPADGELVQGSGRVRRKYLDLIGCQLSAEYLGVLREYQRAVKQRNETLARSFVYAEGRREAARVREPWTELVVRFGADLLERRADLVEGLAAAVRAISSGAFREAGDLEVAYVPGVSWDGRDVRTALLAVLEESVEKDEALGYTTAGPHTDDLRLTLGDKEVRRFGSLGQQQLSAMFLKLAQADLVRTLAGASPLLLVDEMFAILDRRAAEEFLARVEGEGQIFLATAQEGWLGELRSRGFRVHRVAGGEVVAESAPEV